ncbi:NrfD/PsrC family molybdoenzyme membrane anchor subunit [Spirochaetota bacterium]
MSGNFRAAPIKKEFYSTGVRILFLLASIGLAFGMYRMVFGLESSTNLTNPYPWGLWIGVDIASGVALAAGGFTTAALIHIFHKEKYETIGRAAHLTGMLGYTFVAVGLLFDLGRWYNVWHVALPMCWQGNSVLFEVGICVMCYLTVLYLEFVPVVAERFLGQMPAGIPKFVDKFLGILHKFTDKIMWVLLILGVVLSCLHQSSLGNLMVIAPYKMHPLWYSPFLPMMFLISAIGLGLPMVIFEGMIATKSFNLESEMHILSKLAKIVPVIIGMYLIAKVADLVIRDAWIHIFDGTLQSYMFLGEFVLGILIPFGAFLFKKVRETSGLLFGASAMYIIFGVLMNRVNVFMIAYMPPYRQGQYVPSFGEFAVTIGLISMLMIAYRAIVTIFPVLPAQSHQFRVSYSLKGSTIGEKVRGMIRS